MRPRPTSCAVYTLDPLAGMADANTERLAALMEATGTNSDAVAAMLEELAREHGLPGADPDVVEAERRRRWPRRCRGTATCGSWVTIAC